MFGLGLGLEQTCAVAQAVERLEPAEAGAKLSNRGSFRGKRGGKSREREETDRGAETVGYKETGKEVAGGWGQGQTAALAWAPTLG